MTREFWYDEGLERRIADSEYRKRGPRPASGPAQNYVLMAAKDAAYRRSLHEHTMPEGAAPLGKEGFTCTCGQLLPPVEESGFWIPNEWSLARHREDVRTNLVEELLKEESKQ